MKFWQDGQNSVTTNFARRSWFFYEEIDWYDRQDALTKIWHDGQDSWSKIWDDGQESFPTYLARRARFFYDKYSATGKILLQKLARRARFFYKKNRTTGKIFYCVVPNLPCTRFFIKNWSDGQDSFISNSHDGQDFYDVVPNLPCTLFVRERFLRKDQTRPDETRPDETRRNKSCTALVLRT